LRIEVVPNIHEVAPIGTVFEQRRDILFVGGFLHQPNEDAVIFFVREIFPLIRQRLGDVRFFVVGSNPPPHVLALNSEGVVVTGYVKDLLPYFGSSRVFVCPLRYGAGMKGKIGQSMSFGMPVVTTSVGAEGMELVDGDTALIADGPAAFADAVARLYTDEELWARLAQRSLDHIREKYSREAVRGKIRKILGCIAREPDLLSLRGHE
jgi:glycosyltransferase involved in cell wall biosynthesis